MEYVEEYEKALEEVKSFIEVKEPVVKFEEIATNDEESETKVYEDKSEHFNNQESQQAGSDDSETEKQDKIEQPKHYPDGEFPI